MRKKKRYVAMHHPFTAPQDGHEDLLAAEPEKALAKAYDFVLNGWELGGGLHPYSSTRNSTKSFFHSWN